MIGKVSKTWIISSAAIAILAAGVPCVLGQTTCCMQLKQVTETCKSSGCSSQTTVTQCDSVGVGGQGSNFHVHTYMCCLQAMSALYEPSGVCTQTGPVSANARPNAPRVETLWVRNCAGRYVLLRVRETA